VIPRSVRAGEIASTAVSAGPWSVRRRRNRRLAVRAAAKAITLPAFMLRAHFVVMMARFRDLASRLTGISQRGEATNGARRQQRGALPVLALWRRVLSDELCG
jgi:hypothetical protein